MGRDPKVGRSGQPVEQKKSTPACTERQTSSMPQFSPIAGIPQCGHVRDNQNDRRYPDNRYNYRPKINYNEGESRATLAVAKALNKLTEKKLLSCRINHLQQWH